MIITESWRQLERTGVKKDRYVIGEREKSMAGYELIGNDLYGSMIRKTGEAVTVPFLEFKDKSTKNHVRIPAEIYNDYVAKGWKQH
jgi:hypothetical protein